MSVSLPPYNLGSEAFTVFSHRSKSFELQPLAIPTVLARVGFVIPWTESEPTFTQDEQIRGMGSDHDGCPIPSATHARRSDSCLCRCRECRAHPSRRYRPIGANALWRCAAGPNRRCQEN